MTEPVARFFLARRAALDLRSIHTHSRHEWGEDIADLTPAFLAEVEKLKRSV
ncbi:hypothetical protein [Steroidobacter denitrificans]|uniref:hypothetical protein n=1 Tax=Steroidobacter denitrificans TaxID=465721 RepID=UPI0012ED9B71|nr:hypothetical protein [Steroidobacter denitrificans]